MGVKTLIKASTS